MPVSQYIRSPPLPLPINIDVDFVLNACRNLLTLDPNQGTWKFAHLSVQEYFEDLYRVRRLLEWSYCSAHAMAAKMCLLLLNDCILDDLYYEASLIYDFLLENPWVYG
jgi:hypothetical protein